MASPQGKHLARLERERIDGLIDDILGYHALQIGCSHLDLLAASPINTRVRAGRSRICELRCDPLSLPVASSMVDLVMVAHALEFSSYPENMVREAFRVLRPEGHLLLIGYNPAGWFGLRQRFDHSGGYPWHGRFVSPSRVRDWFSVLGLTQLHGCFLGYAPPSQLASDGAMRLWEAAGDRWWPLLGGVYILHAVKRVPAMRRIRPRWREQPAKLGVPANVVERGN